MTAAIVTPAGGLRRIRRVSTVGVAALAGAGFAMSYGVLHALSLDSGVPRTLAWLWPLVVDGFIVVASLSVLHAVLEARPAGYPWALLMLFSAVSVAGNVAHGSPTPVGRLVAAVPPVTLVLAFDLLMRQVRRVLDPVAIALAEALPGPGQSRPRRSQFGAEGVRSALQLAAATAAGRAARLVTRRRAAGRPVTGSWLAGELGISDGYARRLLRQLDRRDDDAAQASGSS